MSNKRYHTEVASKDVIYQSEDGGGIKLTTDGKFIFGEKQQNVFDQLADENYNGNVDVNANNQSFIAVMNENSHAIEVEVPINHFSSLEIPTDNVVTTIQKTTDDCSKEFDEAAKIFLTHENNNTNLGWKPYGGAGPTLTSATTKYLSDYWNANNNIPKQPSEQTKLIKDLPPGLRSMAIQFSYNAGSWWTRMLIAANKLDTSLGITIIQSINIDPIDPNLTDDANLAFANGSTYLRSETTGEKTSTIVKRSETILPKDRAILFVNQYNSIIALYNTDKINFLDTLEEEYRRYYKAYSQGKKDSNEYIQNNPTKVGIRKVETRWLPNSKGGQLEDLLTFYSTYVDLAKKQAEKYVDCGLSQPQPESQVIVEPAPSPPSPSPSPVVVTSTEVSPSISEDEEIFYQAYLPVEEGTYIETSINEGLEDGSGGGVDETFEPKVTIILPEGTIGTNQGGINVSGGGGNGGTGGTGGSQGGGKIYEYENDKAVAKDNVKEAMASVHNLAKNAIEAAFYMNPVNYSLLPNPKVGKWVFKANTNPFLYYITTKWSCPVDKHCAAGIVTSFTAYNETNYYASKTNSGGFPKTNSSYIVPTKDFKGTKIEFIRNTDFDPTSKFLTPSGITKFNQAKIFKGGIYTVGGTGEGHIGMLFYIELLDKKDKSGKVLGQQGIFYTLEFNTRAKGYSSSGGNLAFSKRIIGNCWERGCTSAKSTKNNWFGDTSVYNGGSWAPNGIGQSNTYPWGESISFAQTIK